MIKATVTSRALQDKLLRLARNVGDKSIVNKKLSIGLYSWVARNFKTEGGLAEDGWAALAPSTVKAKARLGYSKILQNTGQLSRSAVPYSDNTKAGVRMQRLTEDGVDLAAVHHFGTRDGHIPSRQLIPTRAQALAMGLEVYRVHVRTAQQKAGL